MNLMEILFFVSLMIVFYTFLGYGILLYIIVLIKRFFKKAELQKLEDFEPFISLVIPCYNEAELIEKKVINCREIDYPANKLSIIFITDGSTDHFAEVLDKYQDIRLLHQPMRAGKTAAENRVMEYVKAPIMIFSDANCLLNKESVKNIVRHFADGRTACVAGEKRILTAISDSASAAGESIYWKYESVLKKLDSELNSTIGAAGELVAFRSSLYEMLPEDTLLDDFMQSMQMAAKGFIIKYEPNAFAVEMASMNIKEELKRKIRISSGNWQAMKRLSGILRFTKTPLLFFQYFSHKVLRWSVTPFLLILIFLFNIFLVMDGNLFYKNILWVQLFFYGLAFAGYVFENKRIRLTAFFIPYYFCVMNFAAIAGLLKFLSKQPEGTWEKAKRKTAK